MSGPPRGVGPGGGAAGARMMVPALAGASVRVALRRLHKLGLRVRLEGGGVVRATVPGPGAAIAAGDTIRVLTREYGPQPVAPRSPTREAVSADRVAASDGVGRGG